MSHVLTRSDFELDLLMAARYAYYVLHRPFLDDFDYDAREAEYKLVGGPLPVGSERREDYTEAQRSLALYFVFSGRSVGGPSAGEELL